MLIALPNADGSFTATLFLPRSGPHSFEQLDHRRKRHATSSRSEFPDALQLIPDLPAQFEAHPQGMLGTIHSPRWRDAERLLLVGDAAHAIVPFHGQGMNCAFEDCRILDGLLAREPGNRVCAIRSAAARRTARPSRPWRWRTMTEMRDAVRDQRFQRQKELAMALERAHPDRFIPRYSMVMFHDEIPYSLALERGRIQQGILDELTTTAAGTGPAGSPRN